MFGKPKTDASRLEQIIESLEIRLETMDINTRDYSKILEHLAPLYKLKETNNPLKRVSPDTWALIAANLAGIVIIVGYEHLHPMTSKAIGFIRKI